MESGEALTTALAQSLPLWFLPSRPAVASKGCEGRQEKSAVIWCGATRAAFVRDRVGSLSRRDVRRRREQTCRRRRPPCSVYECRPFVSPRRPGCLGLQRSLAGSRARRGHQRAAKETSIMPCINEGDDALVWRARTFIQHRYTRCAGGDSVSWSPSWISDVGLSGPSFVVLWARSATSPELICFASSSARRGAAFLHLLRAK